VRHARALLPYLAAALLIAAGSAALVFMTVDSARVATPSGEAARAAPELSPTGRLAFWRQTPAGAFVLWAANLDGSHARPLVTLPPNTSRPFGTRWTGGGRAVAYVTDGGIGVIGLDGSRIDLPLPGSARTAGYRVIDQRWSPSGTRVAATVFRSTDGKSDVYMASLERRELVRAGDLGNAFAGDWLSEAEVLIENDAGLLGALRTTGPPVRRLVDQSAASPFFDGSRVFFLIGPIAASGDASGLFVASPSVWSVLPNGQDARRETRLQVSANLRLDGLWPDGRYLMRVFRDATVYLAGPSLKSLAPSSLVRRVIVSADRTSAIGFAGARIVRIDLTKGSTPSDGAFVVLLDGVVSPDAWVPRTPLP
jgi:hypothetical protein